MQIKTRAQIANEECRREERIGYRFDFTGSANEWNNRTRPSFNPIAPKLRNSFLRELRKYESHLEALFVSTSAAQALALTHASSIIM
jgi:hypothetical protein